MTNKKNKPGAGRPAEWNDKKLAQLKKIYPTRSNEEVAEIIGRSVSSIKNAAIKHGVRKSGRYWSDEDKAWLLANWAGMSAIKLAAHLKKTKWSVINKHRELTGLR